MCCVHHELLGLIVTKLGNKRPTGEGAEQWPNQEVTKKDKEEENTDFPLPS